MDLSIKKSKEYSKYHHRTGGIKSSHTKSQALKDISSECGKNKFYTQNYIILEKRVLEVCSFKELIIQIL